jgi:hypothetical protein
VVCPVPTKDAVLTESERYQCFVRDGGNAILKHASPEAKVAILPLDLTGSGLITLTGEILTTGKFHKKKLGRFFHKKDTEMTKVLQFKYATWNVRGLGEKERRMTKL